MRLCGVSKQRDAHRVELPSEGALCSGLLAYSCLPLAFKFCFLLLSLCMVSPCWESLGEGLGTGPGDPSSTSSCDYAASGLLFSPPGCRLRRDFPRGL